MNKYIKKLIDKSVDKSKNNSNNNKNNDNNDNNNNNNSNNSSNTDKKISTDLKINLNYIKKQFGNSHDIIFREINVGSKICIPAVVISINGLVNQNLIDYDLLKRVMHIDIKLKDDFMEYIKKSIITMVDINDINNMDEVFDGILSGESVMLIDGYSSGFRLDTREWKDRGVSQPIIGSVVRGPREGFSETLLTNTALLRRRIKTPQLIFDKVNCGQYTKTDIVIAYIKGIANDKIVKEVKKRISKIDIDGILDSGYIEQLIEDEPFSLFPTIGNTEKPDQAAGKLLEGRIAILVDGSPIALTIPFLFIENIQTSEDYYTRPWYATFTRIIRVLSLIIVIFLPGFYISAQTYNQEMLPTHLFITMAASKEGVPFPAFIEILIMSILFEVLKEAGVRMPKHIGEALSIVGALVLGEAAVGAGFVSNPAVMITALTGIATFVIYSLNDSITILRFAFMILGAAGGLFGMLIGTIFLLLHLVSIRSFGAPYMSPMGPRNNKDMKDTLIRVPLWMMSSRSEVISKNTKKSSTNRFVNKSK
ncbi:spore germination protein [Vallitalea guaymasensis]|uniref:Spore germination protein n=1 Tax=Vallitalea guaymasensis TaxID=1185412 RepID=A0A8J8SAC8_9FIRM|nr:spore germination protein [Vallitalea guaymasensis]QUH27517.1 spore germination protein [Vallitalea guaymasensis]